MPIRLDGMGDVGFVAFAADENASFVDVAGDVVADFFFGTKLQEALTRIVLNMGFPGAVEAFQADEKPSHAAFHETELDVGKLIENAVEDHAAKGDHLAEGMAEGMNRGIRGHVIEPQILVGAAVDADGAAQFVGLLDKSASSA